MHKLKRKPQGAAAAAAASNDGRKNAPPQTTTTSYENIQYNKEKDNTLNNNPSPNKVSRSPSPSSSPADRPPLPAGRGSLTTVVSEETADSQRTTSHGGNNNIDEVEMNSVVDQLNHHITTFKKVKRSYDDYEEDDSSTTGYSSYSSSTRRAKYASSSQEELQQQDEHDHNLVVADVSRDLHGICSDYAASISAKRPCFGLDKPDDHYFGVGKCDLFTYDCDDGFVIDEDETGTIMGQREDKKKKTVVGTPYKLSSSVVTPPPSGSANVNQALAKACLEGKIINSTSITECTIAAAILSFCLSTHPQDPYLANKLFTHLEKGPFLAREFDLYCKAMMPSHGRELSSMTTITSKSNMPSHHQQHLLREQIKASDDLKQYWLAFAMNNLICRVDKLKSGLLTVKQNEVVETCMSCWLDSL